MGSFNLRTFIFSFKRRYMKIESIMKMLGLALFGALLLPAYATADTKIGIILGFTGPIESLTPDMADGAEMAIDEVNKSGAFMGGKIHGVRADSTCIDSAAATAAAAAGSAAQSRATDIAPTALHHLNKSVKKQKMNLSLIL